MAKVLDSCSFSISPSNEYSILISFRIDWFDLLAVQGTLKSLLHHHSSKTSILRHSAFFIVQPKQHIKKQKHCFANKGLVKDMVFPEVVYGCESWTIKKAECRRIDVFELWCWRRLLRVPCPLDCKEIQPVHPKGDQSWVFIGGTDVEAETPIL